MTRILTHCLLVLCLLAAFNGEALADFRREIDCRSCQLQQATEQKALGTEIQQMYDKDQSLLEALNEAKEKPEFRETYDHYKEQVSQEAHTGNFSDARACLLWSETPDVPQVVKRYATWRTSTDAHLQAIILQNGWPTRKQVGDVAAAEFFFLFGHADELNTWRATQLPALQRVFQADHVNPRLYAHLVDRISNLSAKPQVYGTIMGPGESSGSAMLYWNLADDTKTTDARRAEIGLPTMEHDFALYRSGATIGNYMTPTPQGQEWKITDVYKEPR